MCTGNKCLQRELRAYTQRGVQSKTMTEEHGREVLEAGLVLIDTSPANRDDQKLEIKVSFKCHYVCPMKSHG